MWAIWKGGVQIMVDVYVALIVKHRRTIDQVPEQLRDGVMAELTALGLDGNGDPV
jgi:hypothetical protein